MKPVTGDKNVSIVACLLKYLDLFIHAGMCIQHTVYGRGNNLQRNRIEMVEYQYEMQPFVIDIQRVFPAIFYWFCRLPYILIPFLLVESSQFMWQQPIYNGTEVFW